MLDYVLQFKEVMKIVNTGIVKYILYLLAHEDLVSIVMLF